MNKQDLINAVASEAEVTKATAERCIDSFLGNISKEMARKGEVRLVNFGTFSTRDRKARTGRNPQSGEAIHIEAKTVVGFKAGKGLLDLANA